MRISGIMRISIVEKDKVKLYGIENHASESSDFASFWKTYYKYVAADYNAPVGFISAPDEHGDFRYYTCIGDVPKNSDRFKEVILPRGKYAIIELTGSVEKTIPKAWKFAKENFVIKNSPSLEVYSVGDRLNKKYRMDLWIPISDVLPNFKKTTSKIGTLKRKVSDSIEHTIELLKTDNGKKVLTVGGLLVAGTTLLLANLVEHDANNEEVSDSQSDENFSVSEVTDNDGFNSEVTDNDGFNSEVAENDDSNPEEGHKRKSPRPHVAHRGNTAYVRGGTDEEKQRFREGNNLDF